MSTQSKSDKSGTVKTDHIEVSFKEITTGGDYDMRIQTSKR